MLLPALPGGAQLALVGGGGLALGVGQILSGEPFGVVVGCAQMAGWPSSATGPSSQNQRRRTLVPSRCAGCGGWGGEGGHHSVTTSANSALGAHADRPLMVSTQPNPLGRLVNSSPWYMGPTCDWRQPVGMPGAKPAQQLKLTAG